MDLLTVSDDKVRVVLEDIGEGACGEAEDGEPTMIRFTVEKLDNDEWYPVDDGSYCTRVEASVPVATLEWMAQMILFKVAPLVNEDKSVKKMCELLSWVTPPNN